MQMVKTTVHPMHRMDPRPRGIGWEQAGLFEPRSSCSCLCGRSVREVDSPQNVTTCHRLPPCAHTQCVQLR